MDNNMKLWELVCMTDPAHTKHVDQHGGFTAIDAQHQIQNATEQFGVFGISWGTKETTINVIDELIIYQSVLWFSYEDEKGEFPIESSIHFMKGARVDGDAVKKVATDALTKGLSRLGFNADVFLGKFDGNKYVQTSKSVKKSEIKNGEVWFGKHKGEKWGDVPDDYLEWLLMSSSGNLSDRSRAAQAELDNRKKDDSSDNTEQHIPPHTDADLF